MIKKPLFVLMLESEGLFLAINVIGRSCPHRIEKDMSCRTTCQFHLFAKKLLGQFETAVMIWLIYAYDKKLRIPKALGGDR